MVDRKGGRGSSDRLSAGERIRRAIELFILFVGPWISLSQWLSRDAPPVLLDQAIDNVGEGKGVLRHPLTWWQIAILAVCAVLLALPVLLILAFS